MGAIVALVLLSTSACGNDDWRPLVTGPELDQWLPNPMWRVDDGVLFPDPQPETYKSWLLTRERFSNFEIRLGFRLQAGSNGGLLLRFPDPTIGTLFYMGQNGFEVQVLDNTAFPRIAPELKLGAVTGLVGPSPPLSADLGVWHEMRVRCVGPSVDVWVNGEWSFAAQLDADRRAMSYGADGFDDRGGHVGLIDDGVPVEYRQIEIRRLSHRGDYLDFTD